MLRVIESRKALRQNQSRSVTTGATSTSPTPSGVPDCYLMPPQNKASTSTIRLDSKATTTFLAPMVPRFQLGDIVKCTGKIQVDRSDDRFLFAQQIGKCCRLAIVTGTLRESHYALTPLSWHLLLSVRCEDVNSECRHQLDVIDLERRIYRRPFEWSRVAPTDVKPTKSHSSLYRAAPEANARLLISDLSQDEKAVSAPIFETESERSDDGRLRRSRQAKLADCFRVTPLHRNRSQTQHQKYASNHLTPASAPNHLVRPIPALDSSARIARFPISSLPKPIFSCSFSSTSISTIEMILSP